MVILVEKKRKLRKAVRRLPAAERDFIIGHTKALTALTAQQFDAIKAGSEDTTFGRMTCCGMNWNSRSPLWY